MRWRAWYWLDGEVVRFSSGDLAWSAMPADGLQGAVEYRDTGRGMYAGADWTWMEDGALHRVPSREWGTWQPRPEVVCESCVKRGTRAPDEVWEQIRREMWEATWH